MKILQTYLSFIAQNYCSCECTRVGKMKAFKEVKTLLCAATGTANHERGLETCTVCGRTGNLLKMTKPYKTNVY
jgi:hypothetical protein